MKEKDLESLASKAKEYGASSANPIQAADVMVDERVRLKCLVPRCEHYSRNLMCPPNLPGLDEMRKTLSRYKFGIVLQFPIGLNQGQVSKEFKGKNVGELMEEKDYRKRMRASMKAMMESLARLEKDALSMGYPFAAALSGGCCSLCDDCAGPGGECRHPFLSRPSMEAMGIDAAATARKAGLEVLWPPKEPLWTCLLLVD